MNTHLSATLVVDLSHSKETTRAFPDAVIMSDALPATSDLYPTRANILTQLSDLVDRAEPGQTTLFHYSGPSVLAK